jgi:hypothetical protein
MDKKAFRFTLLEDNYKLMHLTNLIIKYVRANKTELEGGRILLKNSLQDNIWSGF